MVGTNNLRSNLSDVFSEKQLSQIVKSSVGEGGKVIDGYVKPVADGIAGFLGDHFKVTLEVQVSGQVTCLHLFVKRLPVNNKPKAEFIDSQHFFRRERLIFELFEEFEDVGDPNPWNVKAYLYSDSMLVLPDLDIQGYRSRHHLDTFDLPHATVTITSIARFHATFANYETKNILNGRSEYNFYKQHEHLLNEPTFKDCPWLRAAAKCISDILNTFSAKYVGLPELENSIVKLFIEACDSLTVVKDGFNVLIHKDLWANNIMFKYEDCNPNNAVIIDYQCIRYSAPTFDVMTFLYLTTSKSFRQQHETGIFEHYYTIFSKHLNENTKLRLKRIGYNWEEFLKSCENSRMFGIFQALGICPYILLDPKTAAATFDDPETFQKHNFEDRSAPLIRYARTCNVYRERLVELSEEFVERYLLKK
ncbi:uncharacterized protein LOC114251968 [Bombyx mandarina]|uniref:CHK kinase-like domain-containing protein n=2 Tax=Bombyx TaxID=7090 RepID=A0A8R1WHV9_BOMMO|nr:uncharacterized protein LOC101741239 [Bombyx mori]XP_028042222.1 uncharacterized protein LOC114251968 [Bombyx mandarina]